MRTTDLGFTKTKNHHRFGPRQHSTTADLGRHNTTHSLESHGKDDTKMGSVVVIMKMEMTMTMKMMEVIMGVVHFV